MVNTPIGDNFQDADGAAPKSEQFEVHQGEPRSEGPVTDDPSLQAEQSDGPAVGGRRFRWLLERATERVH